MEHTNERKTPESTFDDHNSWRHFSGAAAANAVCEAAGQVEDAVLSLLPPEVTRHLVNAHQEVLRAGQRVAHLVGEKGHSAAEHAVGILEAKARRAEELHRKPAPTESAPATESSPST